MYSCPTVATLELFGLDDFKFVHTIYGTNYFQIIFRRSGAIVYLSSQDPLALQGALLCFLWTFLRFLGPANSQEYTIPIILIPRHFTYRAVIARAKKREVPTRRYAAQTKNPGAVHTPLRDLSSKLSRLTQFVSSIRSYLDSMTPSRPLDQDPKKKLKF